jgi:LPPG:FO 2-phospho-L-lactate transferase
VICVLCGGVGAARMLRALLRVVPGDELTGVVNVGDDFELHGLRICPDLDTVVYTLADAINPETGWGLAGETWQAMGTLQRYGGQTWFSLGDQDIATHLYRTQRLAEGADLTTVTGEIARAWGVDVTLLPVTHDGVATRVTVPGLGEIGFQDYFVGQQHDVAVSAVRFAGAETALPAPGVLDALAEAERIVIAPSNPIVSIGPLLAVPGVRDAVKARRDDVVAVSPTSAGRALKGPAARMMAELGHEASVVGVARLYADLAGTLVLDEADADAVAGVEEAGVQAVLTGTVMSEPAVAERLARVVLGR